jgi:hypothetical protein
MRRLPLKTAIEPPIKFAAAVAIPFGRMPLVDGRRSATPIIGRLGPRRSRAKHRQSKRKHLD